MADRTSKAVLVTGCSSGIGEATARHLAERGWTVYATARRPETLEPLAAAGCRTLALDVTSEQSMRAAVEEVESAEGAVGVLVNNAGYSQSGAIEEVPVNEVRRQFETNVFGLVRMCQLVLPGMRRQGAGKIVNVSTMGANFVFPGGGVYHSSKYAVDALSDALRFEVRGFGVDVITIQPGLIRSGFASTAVGSMQGGEPAGDGGSDPGAASTDRGPYAEFNEGLARSTQEVYEKGPMARLGGSPETVAQAIEKALIARRPRARYLVTPSAHMLVNQRRLMTDRMWDCFLRTQFRQPKGSQ
jgi:NAD(P)-dependent dehydrogenase (short-subunit alcohol dehydrogenase family)